MLNKMVFTHIETILYLLNNLITFLSKKRSSTADDLFLFNEFRFNRILDKKAMALNNNCQNPSIYKENHNKG